MRVGPLQSVPPVRTGARFTSYILPALTLLVRRGIYSSKRSGISRDCFQLLGPSKSFTGEIKADLTFTIDEIERKKTRFKSVISQKKVNLYVVCCMFACLF